MSGYRALPERVHVYTSAYNEGLNVRRTPLPAGPRFMGEDAEYVRADIHAASLKDGERWWAEIAEFWKDKRDASRAESLRAADTLASIAKVLDRGIPDDRKLATINRLVNPPGPGSDRAERDRLLLLDLERECADRQRQLDVAEPGSMNETALLDQVLDLRKKIVEAGGTDPVARGA
jgi:hypothetical protein